MIDNRAGWNKYVLSWDFEKIIKNNYSGWALEDNKPLFVDLTITKGKDKSSRKIAQEFDDLANGSFHYRDWTDSGSPFVDDGEAYKSSFWFALRSDWDLFRSLYI